MPHEHRLCVLVDAEFNTASKPWLVIDTTPGRRATAISCHTLRLVAQRWFIRELGASRVTTTFVKFVHINDPGIRVERYVPA